jgi:hypothetical protein
MFSNKNLLKNCHKYYCEKCDYGTSKKSSYNDHILTSKHKKSTFSNEKLPKTCSELICENCEKKYKDKSGLWRHKKKCFKKEEIKEEKEIDISDKNLILTLIQQNNDLQKQMLDIIKNGTINNTNGIINSNNKRWKMPLIIHTEDGYYRKFLPSFLLMFSKYWNMV